jgi:putative hydrolase of the HAD superfamily
MTQILHSEPTVTNLISANGSESPADKALAARFAPIIRFDAREPFLPLAVGYTIFRTGGDSLSFSRRIELTPAALAIEYAIWWDWDIEHLYELEHVWVYIDAAENVIRAEASWHGAARTMAVDGVLPLTGPRVTLFSEPGKHAFAPECDWLDQRRSKTHQLCTKQAGLGGVWVTPLFDGIIDVKTPQADRLVHTYLAHYAFEPAMDFTQLYCPPPETIVPWPALFHWIPRRVAWWVSKLEQTFLERNTSQ